MYAHYGGLIVVEPSTPYDAKGLLIKASRLNDPVIFLEPTKLYRLFKQEVPEEAYEVPIGKASVVKEGSKLTIVTYGTMAQVVKEVVADKKVDAEIIDLRTINPLDESTIIQSAKKTGRVVIVARGAARLRRRGGGRGEDSREGDIRALCADSEGRVAELPVPLPGLRELLYTEREEDSECDRQGPGSVIQ